MNGILYMSATHELGHWLNLMDSYLADSNMANIFDRIAPGWYGFRHRSIFTPELEALAARWQKGRLLNLGCAHCPDFVPFRSGFELHGIDLSAEMLRLARKYAAKFDFQASLVRGDVAYLPYSEASFDFAISVATYHHLETPEKRLMALEELRRVLRPGGEAFVTVWNRRLPRFWFAGNPVQVPWHTKNEILYRYYYLFTYGEIEKLARQAGLEVLRSFPEHGYRWPLKAFSRNVCLLLRKPE